MSKQPEHKIEERSEKANRRQTSTFEKDELDSRDGVLDTHSAKKRNVKYGLNAVFSVSKLSCTHLRNASDVNTRIIILSRR
jgi:hypothetical protein